MSIYKFASAVFIVLLGVALSMKLGSQESDSYQFQLGAYSISIPEKNALEKSSWNGLSWLPGLDNRTDQVMFTLSAQEIAQKVAGYQASDGDYKEDIRGLLSILNTSEVDAYVSSSAYLDLWHSKGTYSDRRVESFGDGLFKVYRNVEYPYSWALVNENPELGGALPPEAATFWLAHCISGKSPKTRSGVRANCRSHVVSDDLLIEFNVSEQNIENLDQLKIYLVKEIESWIVKSEEINR
ncbi:MULTISPECIES: hypothetical protein [Pseudoalteromonas]|uniref:hypothetical protein n=1 Tax=Pseudoalteromonas TaxID=53246 RepID=UPI000F7976DE|nr:MULTISPECIES: hypothetical protein [Pseudoalteromonas]MCG7564657.1 hypothetical protein [Pseudoalteromonas sp. McH1-42]MEC4091929.1 hypothetical protein [Pseudoalteromonas rubra]